MSEGGSKDVGRMIAERFRSSSQPSRPAEDPPSGGSKPSRPPSFGSDPNLGRVLAGRYRIERLLSAGGMGRVYLAKQLQLDRTVAVKVLAPRLIERHEELFTQRFCLEAAISAKLSHPNIVVVHDYGEAEDGGDLFMVMEFLDGVPLSEIIAKEGPLPPARALDIAIQICRGVRAAHAEGVIHRDLKPSNIMVQKTEEDQELVKVLDFGLVKIFEDGENEGRIPSDQDLTRTNSILGSPRYMAPEQIRHQPVDPRTDIYALGVILYQMVAGRLPFDATSMIEVFNQHLSQAPPPIAGCPRELAGVIQSCLKKAPADRFRSMHELVTALKSVPLTAASFTTSTLSESEEKAELEPRPARTRSSKLVLPAAAVLLIGAAGLVLSARTEPPVEPPPAAAALPEPAPQLTITSIPPGATVTEQGRNLGTTPFSTTLDPDATEALEIEISLAGHSSQILRQEPTRSNSHIDVVLVPVPPPEETVPPPPPAKPVKPKKPKRPKPSLEKTPPPVPPDIRLRR